MWKAIKINLKKKFVSININGLNSAQKRGKTFNQLRKLKADIICLQETHIREKDAHLLSNKNLGIHFYIADDEKKKSGNIYQRRITT